MAKSLKDLDPPIPLVIDGTAALNGAAGVLLLANSDLIHHVIGVVLLLSSAFLFWYGRRIRAASEYGGSSGGGTEGKGEDGGVDRPRESAD